MENECKNRQNKHRETLSGVLSIDTIDANIARMPSQALYLVCNSSSHWKEHMKSDSTFCQCAHVAVGKVIAIQL